MEVDETGFWNIFSKFATTQIHEKIVSLVQTMCLNKISTLGSSEIADMTVDWCYMCNRWLLYW